MVAMVVTAMVVGCGAGRYSRDDKDGDSGEGEHQVAKFHLDEFLSLGRSSVDCPGPALPEGYRPDVEGTTKF